MIRVLVLLLISLRTYAYTPQLDNLEIELFWVKIKDLPSVYLAPYFQNLDDHQIKTFMDNLGEKEIPYPWLVFQNVPQNVCNAKLSIRVFESNHNIIFSKEEVLDKKFDLFSLEDGSMISLLADGFYALPEISLIYTYKTHTKTLTTPNILREEKDILNRALFVQSHIDAFKKALLNKKHYQSR